MRKRRERMLMTSGSVQDDFSIGDVIPDNLRQSVLRAILPAMHDGYVFQDKAGVIQGYNQAACRILRMTPEQLIGKTSLDPDWRAIREDGSEFPGEHHPIMVTLKTGNPCFGVVMGIQTNDGPPRWLQVNSQAVFGEADEEMIGAIAIFSDITPQISMMKAMSNAKDSDDPIAARIKLQKELIDLTDPFQASIDSFELIKNELLQSDRSENFADAIEKIEASNARVLQVLNHLHDHR